MATDFSQGKVWKRIVAQGVPLTLAQLVQLLYNVVDRIYIGHLKDAGGMALTGVGLTFPIVTLIMAFSCLFGMGGTPLFSIQRGKGNEEQAEKIMGNVFAMLLIASVVLVGICGGFRRPILFLFGASEASYVYADAYLKCYMWGIPFVMITVGMNGFINAQGFPKRGMLTTVIGAIMNLILDPIFIFGLHMGVQGAAIATVISQLISALWVTCFLVGKKTTLKIRRCNMKLDFKIVREIVTLGMAGFIMQGTNALVQIVCNKTLHFYGGDVYVGVMTIINSVREVSSLPVSGITSGAQPVLGFNYGAEKYGRVCEGIRFTATIGVSYTFFVWALILLFPRPIISIFSNDPTLLVPAETSIKIYFFGFCFMAFQFAGQSVFQALGYAKQAIFFSLLRKAIIVAPLTLLLPALGFGVDGVFLAEPISNVLGGLASFLTMYFTVYRKLKGKASAR